MKWSDFAAVLQAAKSTGCAPCPSAGELLQLIYAGAFDSMFDQPSLEVYRQAELDVMQITGSKIEGKAHKGQDLGINDIHSETTLLLWRFANLSIYNRELWELEKSRLAARDFYEIDHPCASMAVDCSFGPPTLLVTKFKKFCDEFGQGYIGNRDATLALVAVVKDVENRMTKGDKPKPYLTCNLVMGVESVSAKIWSNKAGILPPHAEVITDGTLALFFGTIDAYNGFRSFVITHAETLGDRA